MVKLLDQATAQAIDSELLGEFSFHLEQLMELAGLAVAQAIQDAFPTINSILIICGKELFLYPGKVCSLYYKRTWK